MRKNLIIDFSNMYYRNLFAAVSQNSGKKNRGSAFDDDFSDQFKTQEEIFDYWRHMITSNLIQLVSKENWDRVILAYDARNYWRKDIYPEYKAHRKKARANNTKIDFEKFMPVLNEYIEQVKLIFPSLYHLEVERAEADDIAAVLTEEFSNNGEYTELLTTDKDFNQLLKLPNVRIFNPIKKEYVECLNPEKELQIKCITGDSGDNIFGIRPKTGPVRAEALIKSGELHDCLLMEESIMSEEQKSMVSNYKRNVQLIDFTYIPSAMKNTILTNFNDFELNKFSQVDILKWCAKYKLKDLTSRFLSNASYPFMALHNKHKERIEFETDFDIL